MPAPVMLVDINNSPLGTAANPLSATLTVSGSPISATNGLPVATPTPTSIVTGQQAVTASAVALASHALVNGIVIKAKTTNAAIVMIGGSGVTTTYDGTGNGYPLEPGAAASFACSNTNLIYIIGTAGDVVSFEGN